MIEIQTYMIGFFMLLLLVVTIYQLRIDWYNRKRMYDVQIEMAQAQAMLSKDMSWGELKKVINDVVSFTVSNYMITNRLSSLSNEDLSLMWTMMMGELCTSVEVSLSDEIKRQALKMITRDYLSQFIKNSVQITIVFQLETNRDNKVNNRLSQIQYNVRGSKMPEEPINSTKK